MNSLRISCGGLRQGDAFRWAVTLRKLYADQELRLVVGSWSKSAWAYVCEYTDLNASIEAVIDERLPTDANNYISFKTLAEKVGPLDDWPDIERACNLAPFKGKIESVKRKSAGNKYLLACLTTISGWKCSAQIGDLGLPIKALRFKGENIPAIQGAVEYVSPRTWRETQELVEGAAAFLTEHVGGMHIATFIGYRRIICYHFMPSLPKVEEFGLGVDLVTSDYGAELTEKTRSILIEWGMH